MATDNSVNQPAETPLDALKLAARTVLDLLGSNQTDLVPDAFVVYRDAWWRVLETMPDVAEAQQGWSELNTMQVDADTLREDETSRNKLYMVVLSTLGLLA